MTVFCGSGIRSWLDWELLQSPDYSVVEIFSRSRTLLGTMETVWYSWPDGSLGDWRNQGNRRLNVEEVASRAGFPSGKSYDYIKKIASDMRNNSAPPSLVLPCYKTERGNIIILDGNHRAIAAFMSQVGVRLLVFAVTGPDNPLVLPDLLHEIDHGATSEEWARRTAEIEKKFRN